MKKGDDFATVLSTVDGMGYDAAWRTLDARRFGVPQRRRRVFLLCRLRGSGARPWEVLDVPVAVGGGRIKSGAWLNSGGVSGGRSWTTRVRDEWFPEARRESSLRDVLERRAVPSRYFLSAKACSGILRRAARRGRALPEALERALLGVAGSEWVPENANSVQASAGHHGHSSPRGDGSDNVIAFNLAQVTHPANRSKCLPGEPAPTLAASGLPAHVAYQPEMTAYQCHGSNVGPMGTKEGVLLPDMLVRRLTPTECERLQGMPDFWTLIEQDRRGKGDAECPVCYGTGVLRDVDWTCSDPGCPACQWAQEPHLCHGCEGTGRVSFGTASDAQRYKVVGNSVATVVLEAIGRRLASAV